MSPAFARLWVGSTLAGLGGQLTIVAVMLHVYELTGDTFAVSMVAVVGLVPMIIAGLYGGMLADAFDRRLVALLAASVTFLSTLLLAILAWSGHESVAWLFVLSAVNSSANSIVGASGTTGHAPDPGPDGRLGSLRSHCVAADGTRAVGVSAARGSGVSSMTSK